MKAVGLITEYNPLHNGHIFHLNRSMELSGAEVSVAVMSGDFAQRGEPAIVDKYTRARMAVDCGVNLVVELPVRFALGSAEKFATGGILTLNALSVENVAFGSESGSIRDLDYVADVLASEPDKYQLALKKELKTGVSFPVARENAIQSLNIMDKDTLHALLSSPNNILGLEYLKAIKRNACPITAYTYKREGMAYNAVFPEDMEDGEFGPAEGGYKDYSNLTDENIYSADGHTLLASSEALRREIRRYYYEMDELSLMEDYEDRDGYDDQIFKNNEILQNVIKFIPEPAVDTLFGAMDVNMPVYKEDFNEIFNTNMRRILKEAGYNKRVAADMICDYEGATETLANRIINKYDKFYDITEFIEAVKDKSNTYKAISRVIFHIILDHKTKDAVAAPEIKLTEIDGMKIYSPDDDYYDASVFSANDNTAVPYVRILAMDEKGQEYLNSIKKTCPVPIITKTAGYEDLLKDDIYAADIYNLAVWKVFGNEITGEFQKGIYIKGQGFTGSEA